MPHFHVLIFSKEGQVARTYAFEAGCEQDALARLDSAHRNESVELWAGERMIGRLPHTTGPETP